MSNDKLYDRSGQKLTPVVIKRTPDIKHKKIEYKAVLESSNNLLNQEVVFPTSNFNELTLEPPKSGEDIPSLDLNKLAEKLNEIENDSENDSENYSIKLDNNTKFINQSNLEFTNISSEQYRIYEFNNGKTIMISEPLRLNVSKNGGHRLYDSSGVSHYIPQGWVRVSWKAKPNQPNFVK